MDITTNPQRHLEYTRQRVEQLVHSLGALHRILVTPGPHPLPSIAQIQANITVLSSSLSSLTTSLQASFPPTATSTLVSYPAPSFPGAANELLLNQLLTKRPTAAVKAAIEAAEAELPRPDATQDALWARALEIVQDEAAERGWGDQAVTREELEARLEVEEVVKRGLKEEVARKGAGGEAGREGREREMARLVGGLRFGVTGVLIAEQTALPRAAGVKK
ncbi:mediator of RNA polymerase II transcription complex subunit 8-domain-containing protein [Geopyxis carbonaria]|nr:mediator of RNA polymerase II transcription complex subunit 8-domain-containing protein [Geopyxis carbonaria]